MSNYLASIAARLKINGAINLRSTVTSPCPLNPNAVHGRGRIFTGLGKWTTLAAIGVENHLKKLGLAEDSPILKSGSRHVWITPLGREVAEYIDKHWDELEFLD